MPKKKLKIAIISLTSCEGCEISVLDLGEQLIKVLKNVDLINFKYMMDEDVAKLDGCDAAFVEGSPLNERDIKLLKEVRKKSKKVIVLGNCAHFGCVQKIKNYRGKENVAKYVYENYEKIENNKAGGIDMYVKVDMVIPGCPITKEEFLRCFLDILAGEEFIIKENPVCYECLNNGYECVLLKGEICLGPITYAGCNAICLKSKQACWGCRGFLPEVIEGEAALAAGTDETKAKRINNTMENLKKKFASIALDSDEKVEHIKEVFGVR